MSLRINPGVATILLITTAPMASLLSAQTVSDVSTSATAAAASTQSAKVPLPKSITADPLGDGKYQVTFIHTAPGAKQVYLAGQFNHWNSTKDAMIKTGDGKFSLTLTLEEGEIPYKFVVDGKWTQDPLNPEGADDNNGGQNSVLRLGSAARMRVSEEKTGDGKIFSEGLKHDPEDIAFFNPMPDGTAVIKLKTAAHDVEETRLIASSKSGSHTFTPMKLEYRDDRVDMFRARIPMANPASPTTAPISVQYHFSVNDDGLELNVGQDGVTTAASVAKNADITFMRQVRPEDIFVTPDWAHEVVWYQIFPERFRNGLAANDPRSSVTTLRKWTSDWWKRGENETGRALEPGVFGRRYGGDFQGIIEKLPYLKELGIGAIYLNPVFEAESLHKYETTDYRHIDDNFGFAGDYARTAAQEDLLNSTTWKFSPTDELFLQFVKRAHDAGIKVVIDGVFNHTGTEHPAFQDIKKNGKASRFANWYNVTRWEPFEYEGWAGVDGLPVLKEDENGFVSESLDNHLMEITSRWMDPNGDGDPSDGIDGWRLDVPNEVSSSWWAKWRDHVKSINPSAIIIGEIWDPPAKWLQGDQFDSVMNYQLAQTLTRFFTNSGKATELRQDIAELLSSVPDQSNYAMMNLMNSHDTDRLVSQLNNPGRGYDARNRQQDVNPGEYSSDKPAPEVYQRMKQLTAVQFTLVGSPMIYYGDEAGMWGADDPEDRKPMIWKDLEPYENPEQNHFMADVHSHFQRLAAIRNSLPVLQTGDYKALLADDAARTFGFRRSTENQSVIVVTNDADKSQLVGVPIDEAANDPMQFINVLTDPAVKVVPGTMSNDQESESRIEIGPEAEKIAVKNGKLEIQMPARSTAILVGVR